MMIQDNGVLYSVEYPFTITLGQGQRLTAAELQQMVPPIRPIQTDAAITHNSQIKRKNQSGSSFQEALNRCMNGVPSKQESASQPSNLIRIGQGCFTSNVATPSNLLAKQKAYAAYNT